MSTERQQVEYAWENTPDAAAERALDAKLEKHFKHHRELPNGRNFRCWNRDKDVVADRKYRDNFDSIFPNSPGAGY